MGQVFANGSYRHGKTFWTHRVVGVIIVSCQGVASNIENSGGCGLFAACRSSHPRFRWLVCLVLIVVVDGLVVESFVHDAGLRLPNSHHPLAPLTLPLLRLSPVPRLRD